MPKVRSLARRPEDRWENNIIVYVGEFGFGNMDWIHLAKCRKLWRALAYIIITIIKSVVSPHLVCCLSSSDCVCLKVDSLSQGNGRSV
jgi:hypothetical protein